MLAPLISVLYIFVLNRQLAWDGPQLIWEDPLPVAKDNLSSGLQGGICLSEPMWIGSYLHGVIWNHQGVQHRPGGFSRWTVPHQPKRPSAFVRMSLQLVVYVRQSFARAGRKMPSKYVCNLFRPEIDPFSVINVHVFENIEHFGGCTGEVCLNWACFTLTSLSSATESPITTSSVGICWYVKDLYRIGELSVSWRGLSVG